MHQPVDGLPGLPLAGGWEGGCFPRLMTVALHHLMAPSLQNLRQNVKRKKTEFSTAPRQRESSLRAEASWEPALTVAPATCVTFLPTAEPAGRCPESQPLSACHFVKNKKTTKPLLKAVNTKVCQRKWWELHYLNPFKIS